MKSELIVDVQQKDISIALLEDSRLVSLQKESRNIAYAVGDLYLAKVKKIMPGLNAAFVDVGYEKDAFLHYLDLGAQFSTYQAFVKEALEDKKRIPNISKFKTLPDIPKTGTIQDLLQPGQELMVQIAKEPISSKGPRLTTELSFTGRFMVLIPFGDKISISQKIKSAEEKIRLRQLISSIKPKGFGVIVRTSAENKRVAELNHEMRTLVKSWEEAISKMQRSQPPALIYEEDSRAVSVIRDIFSPTFESIWVNEAETFTQIQNYVTLIAPETKDIVKLYNKEIPIFDHFNVTRQIKSSFGKTVSFKSGAYIIIEHTE
ncbi:MAG: ribonuclease E/G, partial [Muribaculaceae bacterium]|nr:ribonuclease E/G [Muribaculaceae bacterium]